MYKFLVICLVLPLMKCIFCEEITSLPGWSGPFGFRQYSGYLQASPTHFLHYWFVESSGNPSTDPVLVWLNGGPGCSSLDGLLSELGPIHVRDDGRTLYLNPYTWNQNASIIFLEAPAGVGFSYSTDGNVTTNDDQVSMENYIALKQFFTADFPQFRSNDLYVTGESYGGVYVPTLVTRIIDGQASFKLNLKGMAIGNGMLDYSLNTNTLMRFSFNHGLIDQKIWETLETACCGGCTDTCDFSAVKTSFCQQQVNTTNMDIWLKDGINAYDLYRDCYHGDSYKSPKFAADVRGLAHASVQNAYTKLMASGGKPNIQNPGQSAGESPPCINGTAVTNYLNRDDVRQALFIPDNLGTWAICSDEVGEKYTTLYREQYKHVHKAVDARLKIMVYNGDTDMACNVLMNQKFCEKLDLPLVKGKTPWHHNGQVAGFVTQYRGVQFVTIKGAGHMVPQWKPKQSLAMITSFLQNTPLL